MLLQDMVSLTDRLKNALRTPPGDGGDLAMTAALKGRHPADIAETMEGLARPEALAVFNWLDNVRAAEVLDELDSELVHYLLDNAPQGRIAELLGRLPMDDAAEVVAEIAETKPEQAEVMLEELATHSPEDAAEVRELLSYGEETAGRLMTDKFVRLRATMRVEESLNLIRRVDGDTETVNVLYVVNGNAVNERLIGIVSLRELVLASPNQTIGDIMHREPLAVSVDTHRQEVAQTISKYDLLAIPVLDREGFLAGIVTVDDVLDVLVEEFTEDYLKLVGSDAEEMERRTPLQIARLRLPWLLGTMAIELIAGVVIERFNGVLRVVPLLASFMPVISAISGNVGLQAAAIVVRGLATGHVRMDQWLGAVAKELSTSLIMAAGCGLVLGVVGAFWAHHLTFGVVIGVAMTCSMLTAGFMGTVVPMLSKRMGFDPATTAGPFETAFQDVIGFAVFLWLASLLLNYLKV